MSNLIDSQAPVIIEKYDFLITGENLGQVASQTLDNLATNDSVVQIPILRPLLTMDKKEIIELAKKYNTYQTSIQPGMCCTLVPKRPVTKAKPATIENQEAKLDVKKIIDKAMKGLVEQNL